MASLAPQLALPLATPLDAPDEAGVLAARPRLTAAEKATQRAAQGFVCAKCGDVSKGEMALDVVVGRDGAPVAFCRSDRLRYDAATRCMKGGARRRRGTRKPRTAKAGQGAMVWRAN